MLQSYKRIDGLIGLFLRYFKPPGIILYLDFKELL